MKCYLALIFSLILSFSVSAQNVGSSASGPIIKCDLGSSVVEYMPIVICKHSNGKVLH